MMRTDLQRLFAHKATKGMSSLEDFTTEVLCIAVGRDPRPLAGALHRIPQAAWDLARSGSPSIDFAAVTVASADTQHYLYRVGHKGGRLDLLVKFSGANGAAETLWIEVKIDAGLTW